MTASTGVLDAVIEADLAALAPGLSALGRRIEAASALVGKRVTGPWPARLGERAVLEGLGPPGRTSCGGATQLLACRDGWIALSLARPADRDAVPAWLALAGDPGRAADDADWHEAVRRCPGRALVDAAELVGLPVGVLGERPPDGGGVRLSRFGPGDCGGRIQVVDLSALWAGPLCGAILADAGAEVVKVESVDRPDASRWGSPELHRRLNGRKRQVSVDLGDPAGRAALADLIRGADVVVESARPRALEQLGIVAAEELSADGGPLVWVSVTGHGRSSARVAFGDDAAVAGGLVVDAGDGPRFRADAVADPLAGLAAAANALEALAARERVLVDVALAGVAAAVGATVAAPRSALGGTAAETVRAGRTGGIVVHGSDGAGPA